MQGEQADMAAIVDAVQKIRALMQAAHAVAPDEKLEALAREAAQAHVLAVTAGSQFTGFDEASACALASFQVMAVGALYVAAKEVRKLRSSF